MSAVLRSVARVAGVPQADGVAPAETLVGALGRGVAEGQVLGQGQDLPRRPDQPLQVRLAASRKGCFSDKICNVQFLVPHAG